MVNNDYATKADLKGLRDELLEAIHTSQNSLRNELLEAIHDVETKLLKAFYGFAESTQKRLTEHDGLYERLAILERRLTDLEKRINFPNAP